VEALQKAPEGLTDEIAAVQFLGHPFKLVNGDAKNFKVTLPEDLQRARDMIGGVETRVGFGYDIHPFSQDAARPLALGGIIFEGAKGLDGHSDADVLVHAIVDAVLGAAALGDIGVHFPNSDEHWRDRPSLFFAARAATMIRAEGYEIRNIDATLIAETPKVMPKALEMRAAISEALGVQIGQVSVKATTNEQLGSIGRSEGIAAHAVATLVKTI
jgi:2-C-methyl-D-erythritol 4-phosphate cytidylyltransferase / 2-C-methyl-D-erythritol 2,4-cyclodiphosphate synthase